MSNQNTAKEFTQEYVDTLTNVPVASIEKDNYGQIVLYTGIFMWADGTFRNEPEEGEYVE